MQELPGMVWTTQRFVKTIHGQHLEQTYPAMLPAGEVESVGGVTTGEISKERIPCQ